MDDKTKAIIERLGTARSRARSFGIENDERGDGALSDERAAALRRATRLGLDHLVAGWATTLDDLPELAADARQALYSLAAKVDELEAVIATLRRSTGKRAV